MAAGLPDGNYKLGVNDVVVVDGDAKLASNGVRHRFPPCLRCLFFAETGFFPFASAKTGLSSCLTHSHKPDIRFLLSCMGGRTDFLNATLEDKKIGAKNIAAAVKKYGENSPVPVVLHLDHGKDFDSVKAAIEGGYTSVMIDGQHTEYIFMIHAFFDCNRYFFAQFYIFPFGRAMHGAIRNGQTVHLRLAEKFYRIHRVCISRRCGKYMVLHPCQYAQLAFHGNPSFMGIFYHFPCQFNILFKRKGTVPKYIVDEINALGGDVQNAYGISVEELKQAIPCGIGKINVDTDIRLAVTSAAEQRGI